MSLIDTSQLRLMKTEECAGHTIEYAMGWKACIEWIKSLPTIKPEPKWIPCSERLPEQYGNYLVSIDGEEPDIGTIDPKVKRWSLCNADGFYWADEKSLEITAWMPLPESYKEEQDEVN